MMRVACAALFVAAVAPEAAAFAPGGAFAPGLAARPIGRVSSVRPFAAVGGARRATRVLDLKATAAIQPDQKVFFPAPARRHMSRVRIRWMRCHTAPPRPNMHRQVLNHLATPRNPKSLRSGARILISRAGRRRYGAPFCTNSCARAPSRPRAMPPDSEPASDGHLGHENESCS
jgi:hypothetical protein